LGLLEDCVGETGEWSFCTIFLLIQ